MPYVDLASRGRDIVGNLTTLEYDGKIGVVPVKQAAYWLELFTHLLEELVLRNLGFPPGFHERIRCTEADLSE